MLYYASRRSRARREILETERKLLTNYKLQISPIYLNLSSGLVSGGLMSGGLMSGGLMSGLLMSGGLMSGGLMPGGLMSGGLMSGGLMPGGLMSGGLMSGGLMSGGLMPGGLMSGGLMSGLLMSGGLMSGGLMSSGLMSSGLMSGGLMSGGLMSGGLMSGGLMSGGLMPYLPGPCGTQGVIALAVGTVLHGTIVNDVISVGHCHGQPIQQLIKRRHLRLSHVGPILLLLHFICCVFESLYNVHCRMSIFSQLNQKNGKKIANL